MGKEDKKSRKKSKENKKKKTRKKPKNSLIFFDVKFLQEFGVNISLLESDSKKGSKREANDKPPYQADLGNNEKGLSYQKVFSAVGRDLEKNPVKRDYIDEGPFQRERIYSGISDGPQNIDVHVKPPGAEKPDEEQEKRQEHKQESYPCGGKLRAHFHRREYRPHSMIPGEPGYRELSGLGMDPFQRLHA